MIKHFRSFLSKAKTASTYYLAFLRKSNYKSKIFCIGFNKTGTTTLGKSLEILGYRNCSYNRIVWRKLYKKDKIDSILNYASKFDSFDDLPWLKEDMIPVLDKKFEGSKFVYLTRGEDSWKKSFFNWRVKIFGKEPDPESAWLAYKAHEKFVLNYFKDRHETDFLILDIKDPCGFEKLAQFLGKKAPSRSFPHFNKT